VKPGHDLLVHELPQFAAALLWAIASPGPAQQIGQTARQLALTHYDWDVLAQRLETVWEALLRQVADEPGQKGRVAGMQVGSAAVPEA
jgi:hypothetical protein